MRDLYIEIGFYITSPWEAKQILKAIKEIAGYQIKMSPRHSVINEMLIDLGERTNDN